jgi:hypothetical protein
MRVTSEVTVWADTISVAFRDTTTDLVSAP